MRFARRFASMEQLVAFRRKVRNNQTHKTFQHGLVIVLVPNDVDFLGGWARIEETIPKFIPLYGIWY